jgi:hypothetical protein
MASDIPITIAHKSPNLSTEQKEQKKIKVKDKNGVLRAELDFDEPLKVTVEVDGSIVCDKPLGSTWKITIDKLPV